MVPKATFIMVPSNMIRNLGDPGLINALIDQQAGTRPMILLAEDADECLASRAADNVASISALLNFTDGIFGSVLNLRVVATTNVDIKEVDEAVMRPGRLCRRIKVGKLDRKYAETIYTRLTGLEKPLPNKFYTLAEVYRLAVDGGWTSKKETRPAGFQLTTAPTSLGDSGTTNPEKAKTAYTTELNCSEEEFHKSLAEADELFRQDHLDLIHKYERTDNTQNQFDYELRRRAYMTTEEHFKDEVANSEDKNEDELRDQTAESILKGRASDESFSDELQDIEDEQEFLIRQANKDDDDLIDEDP